MQRMHGSRTGPPADIEYAVEPVGVDITIPSERMDCAATPFAKRSKERSFETGPFESTTSLSAGYSVRSTSSPRITETSSIIRSSISHFPEMIFSISPSSDTSSSARYPSLPEIDSDDRNFQGCVFSCGGNDRSVSAEDKYKIDIFAREIISDPAHRSRVSRIYGINRFRKTYFTAERRKSIKKRIHRLRIYTVIAPLQYCYSLHRPSSLSVHRKSPCLRAGKPKRDIRYFRLRPLSVIL